MLKISLIEASGHAAALRLEGSATGPWVAELRKTCEAVLLEGRALRLHLADLEFLDAAAISYFGDLRSRDVTFAECPPFVMEQLKASKIQA